ncbi:hypothetical protein AB0B45_45955 [Nonomuraea sp. NPDC049152]|uniref:hypothetical protein n=1 Tax=Nonomuraea sp. NPDC049152 TaxID=3154350 RepID=UPI0033C281A2
MSLTRMVRDSRSPLVSAETAEPTRPAGHTAAELAALVTMLIAQRPRIDTVTIGHGRDAASVAAAGRFADEWQARGGRLLTVVHWPESAASWLRHAQRFAAGEPDAWVVAGAPLGWAQMARRLRHSTAWDPARTFGFASIGSPETVTLAGPGTLAGLRGATSRGGSWRIGRHSITWEESQ